MKNSLPASTFSEGQGEEASKTAFYGHVRLRSEEPLREEEFESWTEGNGGGWRRQDQAGLDSEHIESLCNIHSSEYLTILNEMSSLLKKSLMAWLDYIPKIL